MEYRYKSDVRASDLWKMAMLRTYKSPLGIVNIVFTVAMVLLTIRFWNTAPSVLGGLMIFGCVLFPVIQPLCTLGMCFKQLENLPKEMELIFNDNCVRVSCGGESEIIRWKNITNAIKQKNMIIVMSDDRHGYMFTNRVLGPEKEAFYDYLCSKIKAA